VNFCVRPAIVQALRVKLFATDLDGTLVLPGDIIHPRDRAAIAAARSRGVFVTIATGRLTPRTHPIARELGLDQPLVCADGCVVACGVTERILSRYPIPSRVVAHVLDVLDALALASFVFTADVIHSCMRGRAFHAYMQGWTDSILAHADVRAAPALQADPEAALILFGIGAPEPIADAEQALRDHVAHVDVSTFDTSQGRVLRVCARGTSKGAALAALAAQLGVAREDVAVAGDFWNDLSMFEFAGRSFAMPHAPEAVRAAATHALDHDIARDGAFADALEQWLEDR
jgi:Cof subfamily protein (haloacid dehalogenase superfamily)